MEILHSENSTGMISGIRQRLEEQRKRESPQKTEPSEVALVSNDEYNDGSYGVQRSKQPPALLFDIVLEIE